MESRLYAIDQQHLKEMLAAQYKEFGIELSEQELEQELKDLPIDEVMQQYISAFYIRMNNQMFENALKKVADRV